MQVETAKRQNFIPPTSVDLEAYRKAFGDQIDIYQAIADDKSLPSAKHQDALISTGIVISSGLEADYFEAASTELHRHLPGAPALLWQAIKDAKAAGFKRFNLWGIAPPDQPNHRYAKVTVFKTGFGGKITEYVPAHDIILKPMHYHFTHTIETIRKKRRHL